jgi:hypothetical protein
VAPRRRQDRREQDPLSSLIGAPRRRSGSLEEVVEHGPRGLLG